MAPFAARPCSPAQPSPASLSCCMCPSACLPTKHAYPTDHGSRLERLDLGCPEGHVAQYRPSCNGPCVFACVRVCKNRVGIWDLLSQQTPTDTACCTVCSHRKPPLSMDIPVTPHASLCIPTTPFVYLTRLQARYRIP
jgi:hypothetical protein